MITSNVTTITLDGKEKTVVFSEGYPYFWITNKGSADIYVSLSSGITPKTDGGYTIAAVPNITGQETNPALFIFYSSSSIIAAISKCTAFAYCRISPRVLFFIAETVR